MRRRNLALGATAILTITLLAPTSPATAAAGSGTTPSCSGTFANYAATDFATTTLTSGSCTKGVRHRHVTGGGLHWTSWRDSRSPTAAQLSMSQHRLGTSTWDLW